jgi:ABC-2 type transport system permease protein
MSAPGGANVPQPHDSPSPVPTSAAIASSPPRPLYWSVRRELWESRSVYLAPLVAAGVVLIGVFINLMPWPRTFTARAMIDPASQAAAVSQRYDMAAIAIIVTSLIVALFYCLDALHGERRDRSILFWKSLPVSDLTAVLAKASIPLVVLPLIVFVIVVVLQIVMRSASSAVLFAHGLDAAIPWEQVPLLRHSLVLLYGLVVLALWYAPIYAWLLVVSAWARRATLLWAVLPPLALCVIERMGFGTTYLAHVLLHRLGGGFGEAFVLRGRGGDSVFGIPELDPLRFLESPGLWIGLAVALALLFAASRLRRRAEPI